LCQFAGCADAPPVLEEAVVDVVDHRSHLFGSGFPRPLRALRGPARCLAL
jgi:hypothetical protein